MASDDDVIYVDIAPRLDEAAAEKETGKLRDKLKQGAKGAGKAISDVLHSELAQELERGIGPLARNAGEELAKELGSAAGNLLHDQVADVLKGVGVDFDGILDQTKKLSDAFSSLKQGDAAGGLSSVADSVRAIGGKDGASGQAADGLDNLGRIAGQYQGTYNALKGDLQGITSGLGLFVAGAPAAEAAMAALGGAAELALAPIAAFFGTVEIASGLTNHAQINPFGSGVPDPTKGFNSPVPSHPGIPEIPLPSGPAVPPGYTATPGSLDPFTALLPPGMQPPAGAPGAAGPALPSIAPPDTGGGVGAHTSSAITGGTSHQATLVDWTSGGGGGSAGGSPTVPLIQNPDGTWTSTNPSWAHLIQRESSGINQRQQIHDVNSGGNEAEGLFQITPATWRSHGGTNFAPNPLAATPEQQARIAASILQGNPSGSDWGAGLPGRESPGGLLSGLGPGNVMPTGYGSGGGKTGGNNFYKDWYGTGAGSPLPPAMGGYTPRPTQGGTGGGGNTGGGDNSGGGATQQPLGHGSGIGISGGMIGMAEQAGAMAAGAMTFGAGGMAAQVAEQEMNLAIQKGGQMAAVAAMAPLETFGLTGGQMGAPSVTPGGGWPGKLLGGLIGQQTNTPNIAGKTQPPKQPQEDSSQNDPGGGNGGKSQGGAGPSGDHDDPIHVKSVSPGGPPQGAATSAMSGIGYMSGSTV